MTQLTVPNPQDLQGQALVDARGEGIGVIEGIYLDNATRAPEWAAVRLGPDRLALVPLAEASLIPDGLRVEYTRDRIVGAPFSLTALDNQVTEETEQLLYRYYEGTTDTGNGSRPAVVEGAGEVLGAVKDEASQVAETAKDEASQVAETAKEEAAEVLATAKDEAATVVDVAREETAEVVELAAAEARDLLDTTKGELETQAEVQLEQIAESLHRVAGQSLALARGNPGQAGPLADLVRRAGQELRSVAAGLEERGSSGLLEDARRVVRQRPRAAIIGTAAAVVAGARLMGTPAGERLKERLAPLKEQAIEAGKSVAEELKPVAQQRVERVKAVATEAADQVKRDAHGTVADVKGTAGQSTRAVKGTAKRSAGAVKGAAKQSSTTVTRRARAAAPVG